jgi:hypothetical protein
MGVPSACGVPAPPARKPGKPGKPDSVLTREDIFCHKVTL